MLSTLLGSPYLLPIFDNKGVVLDFFLYALLVGFSFFFLLPISLVLRAARHESNAPIHAEIGLGLYRACIGIAFQMRENQPSIHLVLFDRLITRPSLPLATGKKKVDNAPSIAEAEAEMQSQEQPPSSPLSPEPLEAGNGLETIDWIRIGLSPLLRLLTRFPKAFSLYILLVKGRFGLENPMQTGALYGYQRAAMALPFKRLHLELIPDFCRQGFSGRAQISIGIHLGVLLLMVLGFALHAGLRYVQVRYTSKPLRFF